MVDIAAQFEYNCNEFNRLQRLWRTSMSKSTKWIVGIIVIVFGFFAIVFTVFLFVLFNEDESEEIGSGSNGTIALIELKEQITTSENIVRLFKKYRNDASVKGIVFRIESPGGGVSASQEIYEEVKKTRDSGKPVVVSMGSVAASGGYYVACGGSKIIANPGTITGSIGVISQFIHVNDLMNKIGVRETTIKSGKFKDTGSPFRVPNDEDKKYFQSMIDDVYDQFVTVVATERKLSKEKVKLLADGRVFTGRKAYEEKLVDTLGTYEDAIVFAAKLARISGTPKTIREKKKERLTDMLFGEMKNGVKEFKNEILNQPILQYSLIQPY